VKKLRSRRKIATEVFFLGMRISLKWIIAMLMNQPIQMIKCRRSHVYGLMKLMRSNVTKHPLQSLLGKNYDFEVKKKQPSLRL